MKVTIEVNDIELFAKGLNNAIAVYGYIINCINLCCEIPHRFEVLKTIPFENLSARFDCLVNVYEQVEQVEKDLSN